MILGVGSDIVKISRIESLYSGYGANFENKILSKDEIELLQQKSSNKLKVNYLAKRFAAKEALVKALGIGFRDALTLNKITVRNNELGKPEILLSDEALSYIERKLVMSDAKWIKFHLSLSDDGDYALAFVVAEKGLEPPTHGL
jgi:holo-[acyl-carrier protein] synthase